MRYEGGSCHNHSFTYLSFFIYRLDDKLLIVEGNVSYFAPGESNFRSESVKTMMKS